ncbi:Choline-sulfatase [Actinomadura rubteroloni]|uniref:Choline-sulfatase n=1 Tax=Actinomadura rubteroloni TaxID=1926885 RepID=A0A2P4UJS8_9ACTN|nr:sulfatase [Actinomadura rubteroloni]POM25300.1 Choline-sulfatase [Actinomadura rubteroloni]
MKAIIVMFDSLNRHMLSPYARDTFVDAPNFARLARRAVTFDHFYAGSMPCMPARRELHTGRYNFLHRSWGPLEPFDDSMPQLLRDAGVHTHLASDHPHYWEDGGATYHTRYSTWEFFRGQEGDPWKGVVPEHPPADMRAGMLAQDEVNRRYMPTEAEHSQTLTVDAGVHFIDTNAGADRWLVQIEMFDPHEPFFTNNPEYLGKYGGDRPGPRFDWPPYAKTVEPAETVRRARDEYAALVSMCDRSLGRVLDAMDRHGLWDDTLLIVNTDHGFLLGEHGWWAKSVMPWFNELVHLPMFVCDPRTAGRDVRRAALAQTIDIAPTVLGFFGLAPTPDMQGRDLADVLERDRTIRDGALFGIHGGHVNVTDGRYVYMRAAADRANGPLEEYTLMPTHMRSRFAVAELAEWEPAEPLAFTKGLRTMRVPAGGSARLSNPWLHGTLLFDLETDPKQERPLLDDEVELRMLRLLQRLLRESDAPLSQYRRLGLPRDAPVTRAHLLVAAQRDRAAAIAEPLPAVALLPASGLLTRPLLHLARTALRPVLEKHVPFVLDSELVAAMPQLSLYDLARSGHLSTRDLRALADDLAAETEDVR